MTAASECSDYCHHRPHLPSFTPSLFVQFVFHITTLAHTLSRSHLSPRLSSSSLPRCLSHQHSAGFVVDLTVWHAVVCDVICSLPRENGGR